MTNPPTMTTSIRQAPSSPRAIALTVVAAFFVAAVILTTVVLPAEYGIDPLGTGRALGLTAISSPEPPASLEAAAPVLSTDVIRLELGPYEYVEYKYRLAAGAVMVYSWESSVPVVSDFHGAPDTGGDEQSFDRRERSGAAGSHTAPFAGMHGWFWENPGDSPVGITLTSAGFYAGALEARSNGRRITHPTIPAEKLENGK